MTVKDELEELYNLVSDLRSRLNNIILFSEIIEKSSHWGEVIGNFIEKDKELMKLHRLDPLLLETLKENKNIPPVSLISPPMRKILKDGSDRLRDRVTKINSIINSIKEKV